MFGLGMQEMLILLVVGVLLFGRKLPDIGRSLGKTIVEFKKGFNGMEEAIHDDGRGRAMIDPEPVRAPQRVTPSAPVFSDAPAGSNLPPKL